MQYSIVISFLQRLLRDYVKDEFQRNWSLPCLKIWLIPIFGTNSDSLIFLTHSPLIFVQPLTSYSMHTFVPVWPWLAFHLLKVIWNHASAPTSCNQHLGNWVYARRSPSLNLLIFATVILVPHTPKIPQFAGLLLNFVGVSQQQFTANFIKEDSRGVFRTLSNSYDWVFLRKQ